MNIPLGRAHLTGLRPSDCQRLAFGVSFRWEGTHYTLLVACIYIVSLSWPK